MGSCPSVSGGLRAGQGEACGAPWPFFCALAAVLGWGCAARSAFVAFSAVARWGAGATWPIPSTGRRGMRAPVLGVRGGVEVLEIVRRALRLRRGLHEHRRIMTQDCHPALEVGGAGVEGDGRNAAETAEVCRAHLGDELLLGVGRIAEEAEVGEGLPVEPRAMAAGMHVMPISA
jgi:hypothetical protein